MNRFKMKMRKAWNKTKLWFLALLASVGIFVGAYAVPQGFTWSNPTTFTDGSPLDVSEIAEIRFYCDGDTTPTLTATGGDSSVTGDFGFGDHSCYATTFDVYGGESLPSNTVNFTIDRPRPNPPVIVLN